MPRGRPRKPTAELKLHGQYRADRHAGRADAAFPANIPPMPDDLDADAVWMWQSIVTGYPPGILAMQDASAIESAARWWSRYRLCDRLLDDDTVDKRKAMLMSSVAWSKFHEIATKLGLSPAARASLKAPAEAPQGKLGKYVS